MRQIIIDISPAGATKIDALGFNGQGCAEATAQIEIALSGAVAKDKKKKPEFFNNAGTAQKNKLTF